MSHHHLVSNSLTDTLTFSTLSAEPQTTARSSKQESRKKKKKKKSNPDPIPDVPYPCLLKGVKTLVSTADSATLLREVRAMCQESQKMLGSLAAVHRLECASFGGVGWCVRVCVHLGVQSPESMFFRSHLWQRLRRLLPIWITTRNLNLDEA